MRRWARRLLVLALVVYGPLIYLHLTTPVLTPNQAEPADAALVFGAVVRQGRISALHAERLDTAADLLDAGKTDKIVVSNAQRAAEVMAEYLVASGIPRSRIQIDGEAIATPDTCLREFQRPAKRPVILISQRYHLPRIALQCGGFKLDVQYVAADRDRSSEESGVLRVSAIRAWRHTREALLIWSELLGLYRTLSSWKEGR